MIEESVNEQVKEITERNNLSPEIVLQELMVFYHTQAKDILESIIACLEDTDANGKPQKRGDLLALMYKKHSEASDKAIECAHKLAPYKHAKLESIEVKSTETKRFVVVIPGQTLDKKNWQELADSEQRRATMEENKERAEQLQQITMSPQRRKSVEDLEFEDIHYSNNEFDEG